MRRNSTREPIWTKFCTVVGIPDKITYTNFGDHRLRGFWMAEVEFFPQVFTARCYACAVLAMGLCPCLSVCVCVRHKSEFY